MRLLLTFGNHKEEVDWYQEIKDIPKLISYRNENWEFAMYDRHHHYDWVCHFSKYVQWTGYVPSFEGMFGHTRNTPQCVCGAKHTDFPQLHMFFCPLWKDIMK